MGREEGKKKKGEKETMSEKKKKGGGSDTDAYMCAVPFLNPVSVEGKKS